MSALNVLFHELAHFFCGHMAYMADSLKNFTELCEINSPDQVEQLPHNQRRLLELDADSKAGFLAAHFWEILKYPIPGPIEDKKVNFEIALVITAFSTYLLLDDVEKTDSYYSAVWRGHLFLQNFHKGYLGIELNESNASVLDDLLDKEDDLLKHLDEACRLTGLVGEFTYDRFDVDTMTLLGPDRKAYAILEQELQAFKPDVYSF